jgi:transcriptional regulator with XRE-family HTH domain
MGDDPPGEEAEEDHEMAKEETDSIDLRVRRRLRDLRGERGLTLAQVAERANLDVSTLSRLESGKRRLTLEHLPGLAAALGVSIDELIGSPPSFDPRVRGEARRMGGMTLWPLTRDGHGGGLTAYKVHIGARRIRPPAELPVHAGSDWIYVLSGKLRLLLGEDEHLLAPGEAAEFSTWTPHWFGVVDGPVEAIMIFGADGEHVHFHD